MADDCTALPREAPEDTFQTLLAELRSAGQRVNAQADALTFTAAFFDSNPIPAWIKSVGADGLVVMLRVNRAFEKVVGILASDCAGKGDGALLEPTAAARAAETDGLAIVTGEPQRVDAILRNQLTGKSVRLIGWKWRVPIQGPAIAICGFGQEFPGPMNDVANLDLRAFTALNDRLFTELGNKIDQGLTALGEAVRDLTHNTRDVSERLARFEGKLDGNAQELKDVKSDMRSANEKAGKLENRVVRLETLIVPAAALLSAAASAFFSHFIK